MSQKFDTNVILGATNTAFGTSGARGLVTDFTSKVTFAYTIAFIASLKGRFNFSSVAIGIDNRPSSGSMAKTIYSAIESLGLKAIYYGVLPTPALAYKSMLDNIPCIMVTGSHIPFDRNGLKFYRPDGEITKEDELSIINNKVNFEFVKCTKNLDVDESASNAYIERYTSLLSSESLSGKKIGIYEHSSSGRDIYSIIFEKLGAEIVKLDRSDTFVPIDTEAVSVEDKQKAKEWSELHRFDMIFSTDGDGDRPLIADENGQWLRGDILGLITARTLKIKALAVPINCNSAIELSNKFKQIVRTKIGSPYVIEELNKLSKSFNSIAGFEANGGFILGSDIIVNGILLTKLVTRDAVLPAIALLIASTEKPISDLLLTLPKRYTASDRIKNFETKKSKTIIKNFTDSPNKLLDMLDIKFKLKEVITIDGLRIVLTNGDIIHLRASGNSPELRFYAESIEKQDAINFVKKLISIFKSKF